MTKDIHRLAARGCFQEIENLCPNEASLAKLDDQGKNILHHAAENDHLDKVPKKFFRRSLTHAKMINQENVLHIAACFGQLNHIPQELLDYEGLSQHDREGNTAYHYAANYGCLKDIPRKSLTEAALTLKCDSGTTVIEAAMWKLLGVENHRSFLDSLLNTIDTRTLVLIFNTGVEKIPAIKLHLKNRIRDKLIEKINDKSNSTINIG